MSAWEWRLVDEFSYLWKTAEHSWQTEVWLSKGKRMSPSLHSSHTNPLAWQRCTHTNTVISLKLVNEISTTLWKCKVPRAERTSWPHSLVWCALQMWCGSLWGSSWVCRWRCQSNPEESTCHHSPQSAAGLEAAENKCRNKDKCTETIQTLTHPRKQNPYFTIYIN